MNQESRQQEEEMQELDQIIDSTAIRPLSDDERMVLRWHCGLPLHKTTTILERRA